LKKKKNIDRFVGFAPLFFVSQIMDGFETIGLSGNRAPPPFPYVSKNSALKLEFDSNPAISFSGFNISYESTNYLGKEFFLLC